MERCQHGPRTRAPPLRDALLSHAGVVAKGELSFGAIYAQVRIEADALTSLPDEAPESGHEKVSELLLDRDADGCTGELRTSGRQVLKSGRTRRS